MKSSICGTSSKEKFTSRPYEPYIKNIIVEALCRGESEKDIRSELNISDKEWCSLLQEFDINELSNTLNFRRNPVRIDRNCDVDIVRKRINRRLRAKGLAVRRSRKNGQFYIVNASGEVLSSYTDLSVLAAELDKEE